MTLKCAKSKRFWGKKGLNHKIRNRTTSMLHFFQFVIYIYIYIYAILAQVLANRTLSSSVCDGPAVVRRWLCLRRVASQAELLPTHCGECVARDVFLVDGRLHCCASRCSCASRVASSASYCPRRRPVSPRSGVLFVLGGADFVELAVVGCWRSLSLSCCCASPRPSSRMWGFHPR